MRVLSWHAHLPGGRPKGLPYPNLEELVGRGLAPAALEVSTPCKARSPGCAAPSTDGRPRGSPLQGCKNACKARKPRAAQCAAPTEIGKRLRIRRPPEPHLSPTATKALSIRGVPSSRPLPSERQRKTRENQSAELPAPLR